MKNAATYLNFQRKLGQLTDGEKWFALNRLVSFLHNERDSKNYNYNLEKHLRLFQNTQIWWAGLRELSDSPLFYKALRQL